MTRLAKNVDAIPSDESFSPQEEGSQNSYNRQESLLTDFDDFLFDEGLMEEVVKRPRNGPNYVPHSYKKKKKKKDGANEIENGGIEEEHEDEVSVEEAEDGRPKFPTYHNLEDELFFNKAKWFPRDPEHRLMSEKGHEPIEEETNLSIYNQLDEYLKSPDVVYKNLDRAKNKYVSESVHNMTAAADFFSERSLNLRAFKFNNKHEASKDFKSLKESVFTSKILEEEDNSADVSRKVLDALFLEDEAAKEKLAKQRNDLKLELKGFSVRANQGKIRPKGLIQNRDNFDFNRNIQNKVKDNNDQMNFPSEDDSTLFEEESVGKSQRDMNPADFSLYDREEEFKNDLKDYKIKPVSENQSNKPKPVERFFQKKNEEEILKDRLKHSSFNREDDADDDDDSVLKEEQTVDGSISKKLPDSALYEQKTKFKNDLKKYQVKGQTHIDPFKPGPKFRATTKEPSLREEISTSNLKFPPGEDDSLFQNESRFKNELKNFKIKGKDKEDSLVIPVETKQYHVDSPEFITPTAIAGNPIEKEPNFKQKGTLIEETSFSREFPDSSIRGMKQFRDELNKFQIASKEDTRKAPRSHITIFKNPNSERRKFLQRRVDSMTLSGMDTEVISEADANDRSPNPQNSLASQKLSVDAITPHEIIDRHLKYNTDPTIPKREHRQEFPSLLTDSSSLDNKDILIPTAQNKYVNPHTNAAKPSKQDPIGSNLQRQQSEISNRDQRFDMDSISISRSAISEGKSLVDSELNNEQAVGAHRAELKRFGLKPHEDSLQVGPLPQDIEDRDSRLDMPTPSIGSLVIGEEYSKPPSEMGDSFKQRLHHDVLSKYKVLGNEPSPAKFSPQKQEHHDLRQLNKTDHESFNSAVLSEEMSDQPSDLKDSFKMALHRDILRKYKVTLQTSKPPAKSAKSPEQKKNRNSPQVVANLLENSFEKKKEKTRTISNEIKRDLHNESKQKMKNEPKSNKKIDPSPSIEEHNSMKSSHKAVVGNNKKVAEPLPSIQKQENFKQAEVNSPSLPKEKPGRGSVDSGSRVEDEVSFKMRNLNDSNVKGRLISPIADFIDDFIEDQQVGKRKVSGDSFDYNNVKKENITEKPPAKLDTAVGKPISTPIKIEATSQQKPANPSPQITAKNSKAKWNLDKEFDQRAKEVMNGPKMNPKLDNSMTSQDQYFEFKPLQNEQPSFLLNSIDLGTVIPDKKGMQDHSMTQVKLLAELMGPSAPNLEPVKQKPVNIDPSINKQKTPIHKPDPPTVSFDPEIPKRDMQKFNKINKPSLGKPGDDFLPSAVNEEDTKKIPPRDNQNGRGQKNSNEVKPLPNIYLRTYQDQLKNTKDDSEHDHKVEHKELEPEDLKTILMRKMGYKE